MEEKLREYMDELENGYMRDCKQIYDWMYGSIEFSARIGLIEEQTEGVLKAELEQRFEKMRDRILETLK